MCHDSRGSGLPTVRLEIKAVAGIEIVLLSKCSPHVSVVPGHRCTPRYMPPGCHRWGWGNATCTRQYRRNTSARIRLAARKLRRSKTPVCGKTGIRAVVAAHKRRRSMQSPWCANGCHCPPQERTEKTFVLAISSLCGGGNRPDPCHVSAATRPENWARRWESLAVTPQDWTGMRVLTFAFGSAR